MFKDVDSKVSFKDLEKQIFDYWQRNQIETKSLNKKGEEIVFYDGPPFVTGAPHHGTLLVSILKDAIARYYFMQGYAVPRVWGWDCHGLPIEKEVEKKLNIENKDEIETKYGVKKFNDACKSLVSNFNDSWETYIHRIGRWVDYKNSYKTMDLNFMESVIWAFKECYQKGLIYKDHKVTPYCYNCETSLSISDTRESDSTRPRQDPTLIVKFRALKKINNQDTFFLAWTTTPWTLPSNLALAVNPSTEYVAVNSNNQIMILAKECLNKIEHLLSNDFDIIEQLTGNELEGLQYFPLFPYFAEKERDGAFKLLLSDFVSTEEGAGIVHIAPAFGEDDYWVCKKYNISLVNPVDEQGKFQNEVSDFKGQNVIDANKEIIKYLKKNNVVLEHKTVEHNYPHCWRCREPLIYRAMDAWYFNVEKIKSRMLELNKEINWVPDNIKHGRFGKWLEGARDWNISRNRYFGTPMPIWECPDCSHFEVIGSISELEKKSGIKVNDLHKDILDKIKIQCSKCGNQISRIPEVLDCWFESGAMPLGQCHYPFENKKWFENHFPSDFIVEYTGQIRCWFYYLHVLSTAIFDRPAFKNCLVHGTLLAEDGTKISKSMKNFTDPMILLDKYGADALRLYLIASPAAIMQDLKFLDSDIEIQIKNILLPLWNSYSFFVTYAKLDNYQCDPLKIPNPKNSLDRWILAKFTKTKQEVDTAFKSFYLSKTMPPVLSFIDSLTNWFIRRSRKRAWESGHTNAKTDFYDTLYYCLINFSKIIAPIAPFISEEIFRNLTDSESVHLSEWPRTQSSYDDKQLLEKVALTREIASLGLSLRQKKGVKVRFPLSKVLVVLPSNISSSILDDQIDILKEELNVKEVIFLDDPNTIANVRATPNAKKLGKILGKDMPEFLKTAKEGNIEILDKEIVVKGKSKNWTVAKEDIEIGYLGIDGIDIASNKGIVVSVDFNLTEDLIEEGVANDLNRVVQDLRKKAGYAISDRINLCIEGELDSYWREKIFEYALAVSNSVKKADLTTDIKILGRNFHIKISKA